MSLFLLDIALYGLHILITGFNLFGWIPKATRHIHRWCVAITAICWLVIGIAVGAIGYCPLTDWHWRIKHLRGETDLPSSFITYIANQVGFYPAPTHVDIAVGITFTAVILLTGALWQWERHKLIKPTHDNIGARP